jgi:hypothetical protein
MATLATNVSFQCLGLDGKPLAGGKVYTYGAGTTIPKTTYTTVHGDVAHPNPVILDENGKAKLFLGDGAYRLRILDSNDALVDDINDISRYVTQSEFSTFQQAINEGLSQLAQIEDQIDIFIGTAIGNQKGFANGIAPLNGDVKVDPVYLIKSDSTNLDNTDTLATSKGLKSAYDLAATKITQQELKDNLNVSGAAPMFSCRAWVNFNGASGSIRAKGNIESVTLEAGNIYAIAFTVAMQDANYAVLGTSSARGDATALAPIDGTLTTTGFKVRANYGGDNTVGSYNPSICSLAVFR